SDRLERRLRKCLALAELCRRAKFDKLSGGRLAEFLNVVTAGLDREGPESPAEGPPPSRGGRGLVRQAGGPYGRQEQGAGRGLERRLRKCLALAELCRRAKFDKLSGGRLAEFLNVVTAGLDGEVPKSPAEVPPPSWVGRVLFRQAAALYARKDQGPDRGLSRH